MKKILSLILAMLMLACLCACGEETAPPAETTAQTSNQAQNQTAADPNAGKVAVWIVSELTNPNMEDVTPWELDYDSFYNLQKLEFRWEEDDEYGKDECLFFFDEKGRIILEAKGSDVSWDGKRAIEYDERELCFYDEYGNELVEGGDYVYDEAGRIVQKRDNDGETTYAYNEKGELIKEVSADSEKAYTYNAEGKLIKEVTTRADSTAYESNYTYDEKGNLIKYVSQNWETTYTYNDQGKETSCTVKSDYDNYTHTKTYDENGCLVKIDSFAKWELKYKQVYVDASRVEAIENQQAYLLEWCEDFR